METNRETPRGEMDIVALIDGRRVGVEVRIRRSYVDPVDAIDPAKRRRVRAIARWLGCDVAFLGVGLRSRHVELHWVPDW